MSDYRLSDSQIALVLLSDNETAPLVKAVREIVDLRAGITAERAKVKALREALEQIETGQHITIRADADYTKIHRIGHIVDDVWYNPESGQ